MRMKTRKPAGFATVSSDRNNHLVFRAVGDERVASTRYRVLAHRDALEKAGFATEIQLQKRPRRWAERHISRLAELVSDTWGPLSADILFIHRRTYPPVFARRLRRHGASVVFDFDDALYLPPPSAPQDRRTRTRYRRNFLSTVAEADVVICGNSELAQQVPENRTEILPTPVDCERFHPDAVKATEAPVVGWVGHADNIPFLESLEEPLREVARRHPDFRLVVVADRPPKIDGVPIEFRVWNLENEISCFDGIKVGLMPLDDTPWTRAKCAFKALQYMALGIPTIASPVGMNRDVIEEGVNGFLATSPSDWAERLRGLLDNPDLCSRFAEKGRRTVVEQYSLERISSRLISLLGGLLEQSTSAEKR